MNNDYKNYDIAFHNQLIELINKVNKLEKNNIKEASKIIFNSIKNKGILHIFATGHSHMFGEEMFYRAGGLVQIDPILIPHLMQHEGAVSSTKYERLENMAEIIYNGLDVIEGEPFIIVSNSGINAVPIEMAEIVKKNEHPLIVITSVDASKKLASRVKSGKHLYEYGNVIIDNHMPYGDGIIESKYGKIGSTSSIIGSYIAQMLVLEIISLYEQNNMIPPIYMSANIDGGDEHNKKLYEEYKKRIRSLY